MKRSDEVDGFTLIERLGSGGNSEVWRAESNQLGEVALKLLRAKRPEAESFRRFRREVEVQRSLEHDGILPVLAAAVPDDRGQAWLAMPVAVPLNHPDAQAELLDIVERMASIAETVAWLHDQGYAHRDIKPSNLYLYEGRVVVGDFGLIDDPSAEDITTSAGVLGPRHYVAWEVLDDAGADWRPADVYALGKTLWVLLTGQRFPQPGEHQPDLLVGQVGSFSPHPLAGQLDQLLAAATRLDAGARIPASELAASLRSLLEDRPLVSSDEPDEEALRRLTERLAPDQSERGRRNEFRIKLRDDLLPIVGTIFSPIFLRVREVVPYSSETGAHLHDTAILGWRTLENEAGAPEVLDLEKVGYWTFTEDAQTEWSLTGGVALELHADGTLRLYGTHAGDEGWGERLSEGDGSPERRANPKPTGRGGLPRGRRGSRVPGRGGSNSVEQRTRWRLGSPRSYPQP